MPTTGLFADIVFDRPLDHAFTYAVPESLNSAIGVGRRVEVPFGRGDRTTVGFCVNVSHVAPSQPAKDIIRVLDTESLIPDALMRLTRWMADYYLCGWGQVLHAVVPAGAREQSGLREAVMIEAIPESELPTLLPDLTTKQAAVLAQLRSQTAPIEQRQLGRLAHCGTGPVAALVDKGFARLSRQRVERNALLELASPQPSEPITLNLEQELAFGRIESALHANRFKAILLHGVTGSGKTEIYLRAIEEVLKQGKEALVLVPEISLTPQTIARFRGRWGDVAVLHSHLTDAERGAHWRRVAGGHVKVVVGARSAVFAPTRRLGIIVIDEEHENSFKQESTPRYHARDVAVMRAMLEGVPIVMGSATPALESWHNAHRGQYDLVTLPNRVLDRPMPRVELIDLRHDGPRGSHALSHALESAMKQALAAGGQVMLLLNRRGFNTHVHCVNCGHVATCRNCDLSLTYHRHRTALVCHHCGFDQPPPTRCPMCKQQSIRFQGLGTEKLQTEIEMKFPGRVVQRMDSDTMQRPGSHQRVLDAFRDGRIQILLGTQMIAKGLDFPNVTLVGVVNADIGLHLPDFRAAERTFQLLAQVAGRTGRGPRGGRVLVQTYNPEHPCIALAAAHDYIGFATRELAERNTHGYPPYQRLARVIVRSLKAEDAAAFADKLACAFRAAVARLTAAPGSPAVRVLGPAEAPVFRLKNYFRFNFQIQSPSAGLLHQVLREVLATTRSPRGVEYQVDVDAYNMM